MAMLDDPFSLEEKLCEVLHVNFHDLLMVQLQQLEQMDEEYWPVLQEV